LFCITSTPLLRHFSSFVSSVFVMVIGCSNIFAALTSLLGQCGMSVVSGWHLWIFIVFIWFIFLVLDMTNDLLKSGPFHIMFWDSTSVGERKMEVPPYHCQLEVQVCFSGWPPLKTEEEEWEFPTCLLWHNGNGFCDYSLMVTILTSLGLWCYLAKKRSGTLLMLDSGGRPGFPFGLHWHSVGGSLLPAIWHGFLTLS
jgi:hypothetical protein